ncbi:hypothetical protein DFJ58DRAFT_509474 [Suillus subalutaceus]|uniref:uncharacterized protein n=1 Tax=Suillus subalutaceus TaxID=48586 RepID=UPI001B86E082|nr:uncharacterized protein DFJ58DRAFT_509474 [Suillus subalutaceus]KAG1845279.1 hypothetical protein DFJ58DRAFT_509474 [Suillus subalutaceus]
MICGTHGRTEILKDYSRGRRVTKTDNLREHWACQPGGGDKRGSESALTWSRGKKTRRVCLGVITCDDPTCDVVTRPQTRRAGIMGQLNASYLCGGQLTHVDCGVMSVLYSFKGASTTFTRAFTTTQSKPTSCIYPVFTAPPGVHMVNVPIFQLISRMLSNQCPVLISRSQ